MCRWALLDFGATTVIETKCNPMQRRWEGFFVAGAIGARSGACVQTQSFGIAQYCIS